MQFNFNLRNNDPHIELSHWVGYLYYRVCRYSIDSFRNL